MLRDLFRSAMRCFGWILREDVETQLARFQPRPLGVIWTRDEGRTAIARIWRSGDVRVIDSVRTVVPDTWAIPRRPYIRHIFIAAPGRVTDLGLRVPSLKGVWHTTCSETIISLQEDYLVKNGQFSPDYLLDPFG